MVLAQLQGSSVEKGTSSASKQAAYEVEGVFLDQGPGHNMVALVMVGPVHLRHSLSQ